VMEHIDENVSSSGLVSSSPKNWAYSALAEYLHIWN
jgi:hypothetical protein